MNWADTPSNVAGSTFHTFYYMFVRRSFGRSNMNHAIDNTEGHARAIWVHARADMGLS